MAIEKDRPPQCRVCGGLPQALHCYGLPLIAGVMCLFIEQIGSTMSLTNKLNDWYKKNNGVAWIIGVLATLLAVIPIIKTETKITSETETINVKPDGFRSISSTPSDNASLKNNVTISADTITLDSDFGRMNEYKMRISHSNSIGKIEVDDGITENYGKFTTEPPDPLIKSIRENSR